MPYPSMPVYVVYVSSSSTPCQVPATSRRIEAEADGRLIAVREGERVPLREARMTLAVQVWASAIGYGCGGPRTALSSSGHVAEFGTPRAVAPAGHLRTAMGHARPSPKEGCWRG